MDDYAIRKGEEEKGNLGFSSLLQSEMTPLHYAIERGHFDTVQVLLIYHADVNACDNLGPYTDLYMYISSIFSRYLKVKPTLPQWDQATVP